jgi:hypothetical protein
MSDKSKKQKGQIAPQAENYPCILNDPGHVGHYSSKHPLLQIANNYHLTFF